MRTDMVHHKHTMLGVDERGSAASSKRINPKSHLARKVVGKH